MGDVPSRGDWVVGGSGCNSGGTPVSANTWGGFPAPVANTTFTWQSVTIQPLGLGVNAPPTVGEVLVDLIQGNICFLSAGAPSVVQVGVGIYVSKFTQLSSVWQLRDPLNPTDANSDDYLYLRSMVVLYQVTRLRPVLLLGSSLWVSPGQLSLAVVRRLTSPYLQPP